MRLILLCLLLAAAPAAAQIAPGTLDCRLERFCATPGECGPATDLTPVLAVALTETGAAMQSGGATLEFRRIAAFGPAQVYLAERPDGVGLLTLDEDLGFAIASHEKVAGGLSATSGTGSCTRRGG